MTANDLPVCPMCERNYLRRVRFSGFDHVYLVCGECDALWPSEQFRSANYPDRRHDFATFLAQHDLSVPDDVVWIDLPLGLGQIIRLRDDTTAVGVITGPADGDGRAYDVELLDERGQTTYAGQMKIGSFYVASAVWQRRYKERRARAADA
jgi:hypothetical protein